MIKRKHTAVNALFKCFHTVLNNVNKKFEENIDNFLNTELNVIKIAFIQVRSKSLENQRKISLLLIKVELLNALREYSEEFQCIAEYLIILH